LTIRRYEADFAAFSLRAAARAINSEAFLGRNERIPRKANQQHHSRYQLLGTSAQLREVAELKRCARYVAIAVDWVAQPQAGINDGCTHALNNWQPRLPNNALLPPVEAGNPSTHLSHSVGWRQRTRVRITQKEICTGEEQR
jgi:hypothetical protein